MTVVKEYLSDMTGYMKAEISKEIAEVKALLPSSLLPRRSRPLHS